MKKIRLIPFLFLSILMVGCSRKESISENDVKQTQINFCFVPDFSNLTREQAESLGAENNLKVTIIDDCYSPEYPDGVMFDQSIEPGVCVASGTKILLSLNNLLYSYFNFEIITTSTKISNVITGNDPSIPYLQKDTYIITSLKTKEVPSTLVIPDKYQGRKITAIFHNLLDSTSVENIVLPKFLSAIATNLCGYIDGVYGCPTLERIICRGADPFYLGSFAFDTEQLNGACKVYVPDDAVNTFKSFDVGEIPLSTYSDNIFGYSDLDASYHCYLEDQNYFLLKCVEMMGLFGTGNNPMVGATVAVAVSVAQAMGK